MIISSIVLFSSPGLAQSQPEETWLPPANDIPEEVLQTQVITSARSPIDNQPLTATEYAELQTAIERANQVPPQLSSKVRDIVALLQLRKFLKTALPFIPIK